MYELSNGHNVYLDVLILPSKYLFPLRCLSRKLSEIFVIIWVQCLEPADKIFIFFLGLVDVLNYLHLSFLLTNRQLTESRIEKLR